ncbi:polysaccharide biosynthesis/export family protein [Rhizobium setariae]|nr:polysaccharide biosynthesis/export family protein [Rhizobium setariae]
MTYPEFTGSRLAPAIMVGLFFFAIFFGVMSSAQLARAGADDYRLSPGDIVTFDFLDDAELPVTLTVTSDGDVQFPLVGDVRIAGLTVTQALAALREQYKSRQILNDPKIALNITTFRPIFVLGEVKTPGSFPYYPGLTVEQAIGLAGGTQTDQTNPSDRIVARARLRGDIDGADADIVHEAIYAARLIAQLEGRTKVDLKDVPEIAKPFVQNTSVKSVLEIEQRILDTDLSTSRTQVEILSQGIAEAENGLKILAELEVEQKEVVDSNVRDFQRVDQMRKRELNTIAEWLRAKTSASNEKGQLLQIYAEMSRSKRELGGLRLELAKLQADREKDILLKIQERDVAIKKLIAIRHSSEEQFFLMASAVVEQTQKNKISFSYQIRREVDGKRQGITAQAVSEVLPGDVVIVAINGM